ncbi:hypothetical protein CEF21_14575 [Bacillus sp. FJAT-42376]|uniref:hypothetical protein n=1 Tax=Bacillus sp. FJAT-42376 TaxID=2014076 RepID=UPI000F4FAFDA|nr:hypothetical protein [Bacillus sp. FJAT-42376]AZB43431.1 hypothetical protein CEF21_14575 [Bacillus sp. FJAT-42376]
MSKLDFIWDAILLFGMAFRGVYFWGMPVWVFAVVILLGIGLYIYYYIKFKKRESKENTRF